MKCVCVWFGAVYEVRGEGVRGDGVRGKMNCFGFFPILWEQVECWTGVCVLVVVVLVFVV